MTGLFRRRSSRPGGEPIVSFWDWWTAEGRSIAEQSVAGVDTEALWLTMTAKLGELGGLGWELAEGETSRHVLVITAEGEPEGRALARRVVLAAPEADATWSYVDTRPPAPDPESIVLTVVEGQSIELAHVQVSARVERGRFDVQVHHPSFADLPEDSRAMVTFLALDAALGEVDTELWLGEVTPVEFVPLDGFGLTALRSVVQDLKRQHVDIDGRPRWAMLRGETRDGALVAMVRTPLHPLTAPHLDTYVAVSLPYSDRSEDGLPGLDALDELRWFEERLESALGTSGQLVAHLSNAGVRTLHVYVDSAAGLLPAVKDLARSWDQGKAVVHEMRDPGWTAVSHLRG